MHAALLILANDVNWRTGLVLQAPAPGGRCGPGTVGYALARGPAHGWAVTTRPARSPDGVPGTLGHNGVRATLTDPRGRSQGGR